MKKKLLCLSAAVGLVVALSACEPAPPQGQTFYAPGCYGNAGYADLEGTGIIAFCSNGGNGHITQIRVGVKCANAHPPYSAWGWSPWTDADGYAHAGCGVDGGPDQPVTIDWRAR